MQALELNTKQLRFLGFDKTETKRNEIENISIFGIFDKRNTFCFVSFRNFGNFDKFRNKR